MQDHHAGAYLKRPSESNWRASNQKRLTRCARILKKNIDQGHDNSRRHVSPKCHTDSHIPATIRNGGASFLWW